MDIGDKDRVVNLPLQQLHLHGPSSGTLSNNAGGAGGLDEVAADEVVLKFECQMYKSRDDEYLIDIQRLNGDVFIFLEAVSKIVVDMRM